jgi:DNA replication protein DnaC
LLVLDEISETRETDFEGKMLANIVCQRHDYGRDTILISNQSDESLARSVGESITDRIAEGGGIYTFNWPSFRRVP